MQYYKNLLWDKIKEIGGENFFDIQVDIKIVIEEYFYKYMVKGGDSFFKIVKYYYGDVFKYMVIFNVNIDQLKDFNFIYLDQELMIFFLV